MVFQRVPFVRRIAQAKMLNVFMFSEPVQITTKKLYDFSEPIFYPEVIENKKIPEAFGEKVLKCNKNCGECGFCHEVQETATVVLE